MVLRNHTRRIGSMLLVIACAMFIAHTASAGEIAMLPVSPTGHKIVGGLAGETITVDGIVYDVMLVEAKGSGSLRNIIRSMAGRAELVTTLSDRATRLYIRRFNNTHNLSTATLPKISLAIFQRARAVTTDTGVPGYEITLIPTPLENGKIFTTIVVKRTEIHDGKENTYQWETSHSLPTGSQSSLLASSRLGGKDSPFSLRHKKRHSTLFYPQ